jgi:hypothetical protein
MPERRESARRRKRFLVDFDTTLTRTTGFTHDVSRSGLFVRTIRIPRPGKLLRAILHLPDGRHLPVEGKVVRSYRAPAALRSVVPTGFALKVSHPEPEFERLGAEAERAGAGPGPRPRP